MLVPAFRVPIAPDPVSPPAFDVTVRFDVLETQPHRSVGMAIAAVLNGAWRHHAPPLATLPADIAKIVPLLRATGAGALAWRRLQLSGLPASRSLLALKRTYRRHALEAAVHEANVRDIFKRVRRAGIEPILFKGWAVARLYPDDSLRPYGDIDLWLRPEDLVKLSAVWPPRQGFVYAVEPHISFYPQYERSFPEVFQRSVLVRNGDLEVRVPCAEDHLRLLCLHFLFHGGWRALWLCDVALMVETCPRDFDWDRCLTGRRKHADWIACTIGLAHQLLGADVSDTPIARRANRPPVWMKEAVLRQWQAGSGMSTTESLSFSVPRRLGKPRALVAALREHWRNPVQASVEVGAWFDESPRYPLQIAAALRQVPQFAASLGRESRRV